MMGARAVAQESLFYSISLEWQVPPDHVLRSINRFVDLAGSHLARHDQPCGRRRLTLRLERQSQALQSVGKLTPGSGHFRHGASLRTQ